MQPSADMRAIFFSPFSGIREFSALEARVAFGLKRNGHEVLVVNCGSLFSQHCVVMAANGLKSDSTSAQRNLICKDCIAYGEFIQNRMGFTCEKLTDVIDPIQKQEVLALVNGLENHELLALEEDEIPVGKRALYPFLAFKKKDSLDLSESDWIEYRDQLCNTLLSLRAANLLFKLHNPDVVITYGSTYSILSVILELARNKGIKDYFIEASGGLASRSYRTLLGRGGISQWYEALRDCWIESSELPAKPEFLSLVTKHMLYLFGSKSIFVYSSSAREGNFDIRSYFGIVANQKVLLATMSSYDEWFAAEQAGILPTHKSAFDNQIHWVETLFKILRRRPDLFLIIRVHPREFPNQRDSSHAEHVVKLREVFSQAPVNCRINWPEERLSLYDLAKNVDVVLNAWSSAGKELGILGLPVVEWAPDVLLYPPDLRYVAYKADDYEDCMKRALEDGWSPNRIRALYRWLALEFGSATFKSDGEIQEHQKISKFILRVIGFIKRRILKIKPDKTLLNHEISTETCNIIVNTINHEEKTLVNVQKLQNIDFNVEEKAIRDEVIKLIIGLFGDVNYSDSRLKKSLLNFAKPSNNPF